MQVVDFSAIKKWGKAGKFWHAESVGLFCPHCGEKGLFAFSARNTLEMPTSLIVSSANCPGCDNQVVACFVDSGINDDSRNQGQGALAVWPKAAVAEIKRTASDTIPREIGNMLDDAIDVFGVQKWRAAAQLCRTTLESLVKDRLPDFNGKLFDGLRKLAEDDGIINPLRSLMDTLRESGNANAHFDPEFTPSEAVARETIELTQFFIDYVYVFPERIESLKNKLTKELSTKDM